MGDLHDRVGIVAVARRVVRLVGASLDVAAEAERIAAHAPVSERLAGSLHHRDAARGAAHLAPRGRVRQEQQVDRLAREQRVREPAMPRRERGPPRALVVARARGRGAPSRSRSPSRPRRARSPPTTDARPCGGPSRAPRPRDPRACAPASVRGRSRSTDACRPTSRRAPRRARSRAAASSTMRIASSTSGSSWPRACDALSTPVNAANRKSGRSSRMRRTMTSADSRSTSSQRSAPPAEVRDRGAQRRARRQRADAARRLEPARHDAERREAVRHQLEDRRRARVEILVEVAHLVADVAARVVGPAARRRARGRTTGARESRSGRGIAR